MKDVFFLYLLFIWISSGEASIRVVVSTSSASETKITSDKRCTRPGSTISYQVVNEHNHTIFEGGDIAAYLNGNWCVAAASVAGDVQGCPTFEPLILSHQESIYGILHPMGPYSGTRIEWTCHQGTKTSPTVNRIIATSFLNFETGRSILFRLEWPKGANNTTLLEDSKKQTAALATFPSFLMSTSSTVLSHRGSSNKDAHPSLTISSLLPHTLSWHGSFVQSVRGLSEGPQGGPTVFFNASDLTLKTVIVASQMGAYVSRSQRNYRKYWNAFTAGNNKDWSGTRPAFSPGISGRISNLPGGFQHDFLLYEGTRGGITSTLDEWGSIMTESSQISRSSEKVADVTLEKIGIQTDNGAFYCFCADSNQNCSNVLLKEKDYLDAIGVPIGYVSYQGAGTSSGRGKAAPWCVEKWSADGGQDRTHYPLDTKDLQNALGVPLQLYVPYFCPNSTYFASANGSQWKSVASNTDLPGCSGFAFETVDAHDSKPFFTWFLKKGIASGMASFETDFMNQNVNCVDAFVQSATAADEFLFGMAEAAADLNIPIQWCYASPNEVFASLDMLAVTNFRVSFDFCYGQSYDIGESSLLVWALGAAPSKDTLWSTDNNKTETPGCNWTPDHETIAAELHVVLALMTTGPFGLSDGIGMSNATLLNRVIAKDGTLLQPSKPITAVDSTFLKDSKLDGYLYGTHCGHSSWIFVSFQLKDYFPVTLRDFWPPPPPVNSIRSSHPELFAYRTFSKDPECRFGQDAVQSGCVTIVRRGLTAAGDSLTVFMAPPNSFSYPGSDLAPNIVTVWMSFDDSGIIFMGELNKYVPLSPKRFTSLNHTRNGISTVLRGSAGERIELFYLVRRERVSGESWYEVVSKEVLFSESNTMQVVISVQEKTSDA